MKRASTLKTSACSRAMLRILYRRLRAEVAALRRLLPAAKESVLRGELERELADCGALCREAGLALCRAGGKPRRSPSLSIGFFSPSPARLYRHLRRQLRGAASLIRSFECLPCSERALSLGRRALRTMEDSIARLERPS